MLHADIQYAPEKIKDLIKPIEEDKADMVIGSRIAGNPLKGGMPLWKFLGNRFLTKVENVFLNLNLSEYHSGFRAYNVNVLKEIRFEDLNNEYSFDTDIIVKFREKNFKITEIPIPTHYGKESSQIGFLKSLKYGINIFKIMIRYKYRKSQPLE